MLKKINLSSSCRELIRTGLSLVKRSFLSKQRGLVTRSRELSSSSQGFKFEFIINISELGHLSPIPGIGAVGSNSPGPQLSVVKPGVTGHPGPYLGLLYCSITC